MVEVTSFRGCSAWRNQETKAKSSLLDYHTDKKENKIFLIYCIRKFRMEQLQSHIWLTASSYMGKYLRISSYIRKPFLIYDFATAPLEFEYKWGKFYFIFYQCSGISYEIEWGKEGSAWGATTLSHRQTHCNENPIYVFLFWEWRSLSPNFYIHVSVINSYIPRIGPSRKGRSIVGIYKSLTETWMWKVAAQFLFWEYLFPIFGIGSCSAQ